MKSLHCLIIILILGLTSFISANDLNNQQKNKKKLIYLVSDIKIPFWKIMAKGIKTTSHKLGYDFEVYNANNMAQQELTLVVKAIKENVAGIIVSPTNSSACVTILKLAKNAGIPVVISDIGTDAGEYVSYISSDNYMGAYTIGKILTQEMIEKNWQNGQVGIIAIPQKRLNGQQRTAGFMKALDEVNIKNADIKQLKEWTEAESYTFAKALIEKYPDLRAIWLQSSNTYKGVLQAVQETNKEKEIIFLSFDAEPEFIDLIPQKRILVAAMQQPYLMGKKAAQTMHDYLNNKSVPKNIQLPILGISTANIEKNLPIIRLNVLGIEK